jgi:hypothetical protein
MVFFTLRPVDPRGNNPVLIGEEAELASESVWRLSTGYWGMFHER